MISDPHAPALVLSLKPHWSGEILAGRKIIEVRRRFPTHDMAGRTALIYTTSPVKALTGQARVVSVERMTVDALAALGGETRIPEDVLRFYLDTHGFAIRLRDAQARDVPIPLAELRARFGFTPPQSFCYAKPGMAA